MTNITSRVFRSLLWLVVWGFVSSCQKEFNFISPLVNKQDKEYFDSAIARAKGYYDEGKYDLGLKYANLAQKANPNSEQAAILLGFLYLGQLGMSPFELVKKFSTSSSQNSSASSEAQTTSKSKSTFKIINKIITFTQSDINKLGDLNTSDPEIPILEPYCANKARGILEPLQASAKIIKAACPFVNSAAKKKTDLRHQCEDLTAISHNQNQAVFLWVIAHMIESVYFYNVISYSTGDSSDTNLELKSKKLKSQPTTTPEDLVSFTNNLKILNQEIDQIIPSSENCSSEDPQTQAFALVNDIYAMNEGMKLISVLPKDFKSKFSEFSNSLTVPKVSSSGVGGSTDALVGLRSELTKSMSDSLYEKLDSIDKTSYSESQRADLCDAYDGLSANASDKIPSICK